MAISSILRLISYSFNTNFLLVNFAIVKKKLQEGGEHRPPSPSFWVWYPAIFVLLPKTHVFVTSSSEDENIIK